MFLKIQNMMEPRLASMVYRFFDKRFLVVVLKVKLCQLAEELHQPIIRKFEKHKVYSSFKDNIWCAGLADAQLISQFSKGFCSLLCAIDNYRKYARIVPLKDRKGITITNAFHKILDESG